MWEVPTGAGDGMDAGGTTPWTEEVEPRLEQRPRATQEQLPERLRPGDRGIVDPARHDYHGRPQVGSYRINSETFEPCRSPLAGDHGITDSARHGYHGRPQGGS